MTTSKYAEYIFKKQLLYYRKKETIRTYFFLNSNCF